MIRFPRIVLFFLLLVPSTTHAAPPNFDTQIAPLLAAHCLDCHSGPKPKGELDLSRKAGVLGGKTPSVIANKPTESELWKRIAAQEMPPKKPLAAADAKLIQEWIAAGANWGTDPIDPFRLTTTTRAGADWWALQPLQKVKPPTVASNNSLHPIDAFIVEKLQKKKLELSPAVDRRTLIRRLSFDLTGLPPSPEAVEAFVRDDTAGAYEKLVDQLLASPHYGERWARHWLDVVRYGETDGFERNTPRPNAWHYRDWVIQALNADMPYTEFARLQIAGDVLKPNDAAAIKATGYLVAGVHNTVLGNDQMRAVARQDELEESVGSMSQTFLGLTVNCARCHDHKFDPIRQAEYYRLASALSGVGFGERSLPTVNSSEQIALLQKERERLEAAIATIEAAARKALSNAKGAKPEIVPPAPVAAWDFRTSEKDLIGKLHAKAIGGAKRTEHGVVLNGKDGFFRTPPLEFDLQSKTLEAWVKLDSLKQQGGGVMTIETPNGNEFDAIVYGEREPGRWMAGSNFYLRYQSLGGAVEADAQKEFVHVAMTYSADGTIASYRNGKPHGKAYVSKGLRPFSAKESVIAFGCRHEPAGANKMLAGTISKARLYDKALSAEEIERSFASEGGWITEREIESQLQPAEKKARAEAMQKRDRISEELAQLRTNASNLKAYANVPRAPETTRVLARGDLAAPGDVVAPAGLSAIHGIKSDFELKPDAPDTERRRKLAEWMSSENNPLFSRVLVNRVWHYHFGVGIVDTPNDLGFNGGRPSHPELLDWLAAEFIAKKYSIKVLHKLIVTSAVYRQASTIRNDAFALDAENRLLWRYKPHRQDGETIRDAMLQVAGLLNPQVGGKGFNDYKIRNFNGTAYFDPYDPIGPEFHRRSIYRFVPRGANPGLLDAFDCPDPAAAAPRRAITTTPLQALALWNNGFALRMADALAVRLEKESQKPDEQIQRAWQLVYQRAPNAKEKSIALELFQEHGLKALCRVLFNSNEFVMVE